MLGIFSKEYPALTVSVVVSPSADAEVITLRKLQHDGVAHFFSIAGSPTTSPGSRRFLSRSLESDLRLVEDSGAVNFDLYAIWKCMRELEA